MTSDFAVVRNLLFFSFLIIGKEDTIMYDVTISLSFLLGVIFGFGFLFGILVTLVYTNLKAKWRYESRKEQNKC